MTDKYKTGTLKAVSQYGGLLLKEDEKSWINADKTVKDNLSLDRLKGMSNKKVDIELSPGGQWIGIDLSDQTTKEVEIKHEPKSDFTNANKLKSITKIKIMITDKATELETEVNKFAIKHNVVATQTHINGNNLIAIIYYKVVIEV